jgi:hypothetical protein
MAFDPTGKTRQALITEIRRLEAEEATLIQENGALSASNTSLQIDLIEAESENQNLINEAVVKDSLIAEYQATIDNLEIEVARGDAVISGCNVLKDALIEAGVIEIVEIP